MTPTRNPLYWPTGWPRRSATGRKEAAFKRNGASLSVTDGVRRVLLELQRSGVPESDVIVSTDVRTRLDGLPRSGEPKPADPGAAVYWQRSGGPMLCMAIDRYDEVADNLAAIAATLEALRAIERHGGGAILDRAFAGFKALPAPSARPWVEVLGLQAMEGHEITPSVLRQARRRAASTAHPDKPGGSHEAMAAVNLAYERACDSMGYAP